MGIHKFTRACKGLLKVTEGHKGVKGGYKGLQEITRGYKRLQKTSFLTRMSPDTFSWSILHKNQS